jgi:hypothetical protein
MKILENLKLNDGNKDAKMVIVLPMVGLGGQVPELLFEKRQLIPALQQLLVSR